MEMRRDSEETLDLIKKACKFVVAYRNPKSHKEIMEMNEVFEVRQKIVEYLNKIIDKLYE